MNTIKLTLCFAILALVSVSHAQSNSPLRTSRDGFLIGFNVGGGVSAESGNDTGMIALGFRIGGGLNDKVIMMLENSTLEQPDGNLRLSSSHFATQFFLSKDFYVRPALGFGYKRTGFGDQFMFSTMLSTGYDFRIMRRFAIAPEAFVNYQAVNGNRWNLGGSIAFTWYYG